MADVVQPGRPAPARPAPAPPQPAPAAVVPTGPVFVLEPSHYLGAGAVFMTRTAGGDRRLLTDAPASAVPASNRPTLFSSDGLNTYDSYEPGFEIKGGLRLGDGWWLTGHFLWLNEFKADVTGPGNLNLPIGTVNPDSTDGASFARIKQTSEMHFARLGAKVALWRWLPVYGGFRYINLQERLRINIQDTVNVPSSGDYEVRASNILVGGEFGLDARFQIIPNLWLNFFASFSPLYARNTVGQTLSEIDVPGLPTENFVAYNNKTDRFAYGADGPLGAKLRFGRGFRSMAAIV